MDSPGPVGASSSVDLAWAKLRRRRRCALKFGPTDDHQAVARLNSVSVRYGQTQALSDISMSLLPAQIYVLMGPNGSGKSTLVRLLAGSIKPSAGTVEIARARDARPAPGNVGLIPQEIALYPFLTARENCVAFARIAGLSRTEAAVVADDALRVTACVNVAATRVSRLSGGYRRRINIAVALVAGPDLLILDEPTAGVDAEARKSIAQTLSALRANGTSILMITHDFEDADTLADRVGFLSHGILVAEGEPRTLIDSSFGSAKQWELMFNAAPDRSQRDLLLAEGAEQIDAASFRMFKTSDNAGAMRFVETLEREGLTIKDLRLSAPGLQTLYNRFCETGSDA